MAFCKFCGSQIPDGGVCNCQEAQNERAGNFAPQQQYAPYEQNSTPAPDPAPAPYVEPARNNDPFGGGQQPADGSSQQIPVNKLKTFLVPVAVGLVAFLLILALFVLLLGGGYKTPINNAVKGFNKNDAKMLMKAVVDKETLEDMEDDIDDWDDLDDSIEDMKESFEDAFGDDIKLEAEILSKKDTKKKEIKKLEDMYDELDMDVDIKKAYKVKVKFTLKGDDDDIDEKINLYSVKLKGEGWKVMFTEDSMEDINTFTSKLSKKIGVRINLDDLLEYAFK